MTWVRHHLLARRDLCGMIVALALLMKLVVPAGFMVSVDHRQVTLVLCSGTGAQTMSIDLAAKDSHDHQKSERAEMPCAFSSLATPGLAAIDPLILAAAILFVMALAFGAPTPRPAALLLRLRPPLRGPPPRS